MSEKTQYDLGLLDDASVQSRFYSKVSTDIDSKGCRLWTDGTGAGGYGRMGVKGLVFRAHRIACYLEHGPPPDKKHSFACHTCDNPLCCEGSHLVWGTKSFNSRDRDSKRRHWLMRNPRGQSGIKNPNARLSDELVDIIRSAQGTQKDIANRYGLSQQHVCKIKSGKRRGCA